MSKGEKSEAQDKQTTVEEGTQFKGTLHSTCQVMVRGVVEGELSAPSVIVSETGTVLGNVKASCIRAQGVLAGRVDADDVYLSGSVRSDTVIRAKTLEVKLQAHNEKLEVTFGECILDIGDDPSAEASESPQKEAGKHKKASQARRSVPPAEAAERVSEQSKPKGSSEEAPEEPTNHRSVPPPPS